MDNLLLGGFAGIASRTVTAPIELLKLQKQNNYLKNGSLSSVVKNEGVRYLWKGNMTNCIRVFPQYAFNFGIFEKSKELLKENLNIQNPDLLHFTSGAISGVSSLCIIYPLETARTHLSLQTNKKKYKGLFDVLLKLKTRELYAGLRMSVFGFGPWNAINFMSYNKYKTYFDESNTSKLLCGGCAGVTAITVTYPTDLIRKRLQMQSFPGVDIPKYNGIVDCSTKILKEEGFIGLYRGLFVSYVKCFPTLAIQFWIYDTLKELL